jgi:hypothetical protein
LKITKERRKRVIDLYFNQHKSYAEIAQIERMSPRDIHAIIKEEEARQQKHKQQEISAQAYKLFSEGKTPVEVAVTLNLGQPEVTKLYREYWKLKRLHKLNCVYTELGDEGIGDFLKLHKLSMKEGISRGHVIKLLKLADEDNPFGLSQLEKRCKGRIDEIHELDMQIEKSKKHLHSVNDEIASAKVLLNSYHMLCERKRQEAENLNNEISRLETLVSRFMSNNEEYLKIEKTVEEKVKSVFTDNKQILQFALASVIEAIRQNPDKYNNLLLYNAFSSSRAIISAQQSSSQPYHHNEDHNSMILDVADKLYSTLLKQLVCKIMDNTTAELKS